MLSFVPLACLFAAVAVTAVAAVTDARGGTISNWLTLPAIVLGPLAWGAYGGFWRTDRGSLGASLLSAGLCALVPWLLFRKHAMGAGDVKVFAAVGALALASTGIEAEFYACCAVSLIALARLAWEGKLLRTLANALFLLVNPVLPKRHRRDMSRELLTKVRFGVAIFLGTLAAAAGDPRLHALL